MASSICIGLYAYACGSIVIHRAPGVQIGLYVYTYAFRYTHRDLGIHIGLYIYTYGFLYPPKNGLIALQTPRTSHCPLFTIAR